MPFADQTPEGLADQTGLDRLQALQDELVAFAGERMLFPALETHARATTHVYCDGEAATRGLIDRWLAARMPPARAYHLGSRSTWRAIRPFQ